jgi:hypothetical protein
MVNKLREVAVKRDALTLEEREREAGAPRHGVSDFGNKRSDLQKKLSGPPVSCFSETSAPTDRATAGAP